MKKIQVNDERETRNPFPKLIRVFKDAIYDLKVKLHRESKVKFQNLADRNRHRLIFYISIFAIPVIQFLIFYVYVNFNSILLAFKNMDIDGNYEFIGFENVRQVISDLFTDVNRLAALKNTGILFCLTLLVGIPLPTLVSYYIFKKRFGHKAFSVILYLPSIMSTLALSISYKYFCENAIPEIWSKLFGVKVSGLLYRYDSQFAATLIFTLWFGIGSSFMIYVSTMSSISESVIESAALDGAKPLQEFIYIIFPHIYPTFITYVITNIAVAFVNQMNLYNLYGNEAPGHIQTLGYFLYRKTALANLSEYPYLAAFGVVCTLICIPICFSVKKFLEKIGPSDK